MYKLLLCWRYLRTRYIALASIVSVMLGVATMIVVNSVMAGFSREMQERIKGVNADVSVDGTSLSGLAGPAEHMQKIEEVAGEYIEAMTPAVFVPAMLSFDSGGQTITMQVKLVGVDPRQEKMATRFLEYLQHENHRLGGFDFKLQGGGYDLRDRHGADEAPLRIGMENAGWRWRNELAKRKKMLEERQRAEEAQDREAAGGNPAKEQPDEDPFRQDDPFGQDAGANEGRTFDMATEQHTGCVIGMALVSQRVKTEDGDEERFLLLPGSDVQLSVPTAGAPPKIVSDNFTVVDFYESKMSQFDQSFVFVPIDKLQEMRGMFDAGSGVRYVNSIQIKLKNEADAELVRDKLRAAFPGHLYSIQTWREKQGPLLGAVQLETAILNVLLFLIIAVAGFGILAIFFTIVVEKTKDIGILKSLGAGSGGVMGIFLGYGLLLGVVGSGVGLVIGLLFVKNINLISDELSKLTGREVFDPTVYYFYEIPTLVSPFTVACIVVGALVIAVLASVLPARRAARLNPVEALRFE